MLIVLSNIDFEQAKSSNLVILKAASKQRGSKMGPQNLF